MVRARRFVEILFWETLQNVGAVVGFMFAVEFFTTNQWLLAVLAMSAGAILTAVVIAMTEAKKSPGHYEPVQTVIVNIIVMTAIGLVLAVVVGKSTWLVSFAIGVLAGSVLAIAQAVSNHAAVKPSGNRQDKPRQVLSAVRHGVAVGVGAGGVFGLLNLLLILQWPAWLNALIVLGVISPIIAAVDYPPEEKQEA